jgi:hypothetical protein
MVKKITNKSYGSAATNTLFKFNFQNLYYDSYQSLEIF